MPTANVAPLSLSARTRPIMIHRGHPPAHHKKDLRAEAAFRRKAAHEAWGATAPEAVAALFLRHFRPAPGLVAAAYWPMRDELDLRPLMEILHGLGCIVALPVVVARHRPLDFRAWMPDCALEPGGHGTRHPSGLAQAVVPALLLVPMLAFDRAGYRLGYGGGYYDRTLEKLRAERKVVVVGVAYQAQEIDKVPHDGHDQRLDWVLTEQGLLETGQGTA